MAQPGPVMMAKPTRPLGVSILAVLVGLLGIILIIGGVALLALSAAFSTVPTIGLFGLTGVAIGAVVLVLGLLWLATAIGLWRLHTWALVLALIVTFIGLASNGYTIAVSGVSSGVVGLVIYLIIFVYLLAVRRHFR